MFSAIRTSVLAAIAAGPILISASGAKAFPVTYDFGVLATTGPLAHTGAAGAFSIDSSLVPPGGGDIRVPISLSFSWNGVAYTQGTAILDDFIPDTPPTSSSFGAVRRAIFGSSDGANGWTATYDPGAGPDEIYFVYQVPGLPPFPLFEGTLLFNPTPCGFLRCSVDAPEPASLALFGAGLAGLGLVLRSRRV